MIFGNSGGGANGGCILLGICAVIIVILLPIAIIVGLFSGIGQALDQATNGSARATAAVLALTPTPKVPPNDYSVYEAAISKEAFTNCNGGAFIGDGGTITFHIPASTTDTYQLLINGGICYRHDVSVQGTVQVSINNAPPITVTIGTPVPIQLKNGDNTIVLDNQSGFDYAGKNTSCGVDRANYYNCTTINSITISN